MAQELNRWGNPVSVYAHDTGGIANPSKVAATAWGNGGFAVVSNSDVTNLLVVSRYDAFGYPVDAAPLVAAPFPPLSPPGSILWDIAVTASGGGDLVVAWTYGTFANKNIYYSILDASGSITTPTSILAAGVGDQSDVSLAPTGFGAFKAVWTDSSQNGGDIVSSEITIGSNTPSLPVTINSTVAGSQFEPALATLANGGNVYVFQEGLNVFFRTEVFVLSPVIQANNNTLATKPDVTALTNGRFAIAWVGGPNGGPFDNVYVRVFNADGTAASGDIEVSTAGVTTDVHIAPLNDGGFYISWHNQEPGSNDDSTFVRAYDSSFIPAGVQIGQFLPSQSEDVIGLADGRSVVVSLTDGPARDITAYIIDARQYSSVVFGTIGDDWIAGSYLRESIIGSDGNDHIAGDGGYDFLVGGPGDDTLIGGNGNDTLRGDGGADVYVCTPDCGLDTIVTIGGIATDRFDLTGFGALSSASHALGLMSSYQGANSLITLGFDATIFLSNIFTTQITGANFLLAAPVPGNTMYGTGGPDTITGTAGVDSITGGDGNDTLGGYGGNDTLVADNGQDYLYGGIGNDLLDGGLGVDVLIGEEGDDTMMAGADDDYLYGGTGDNVMAGGGGLDVFISEGFRDVMNGGADRGYFYRYATGYSQTFGGSDIDIFVGGGFASNDTVYGFDGDDFALGGAGNDELVGGIGNDILIGEDGNDTLDGGTGVNYLYADGTGSDLIRVNATLGGTQTQLLVSFEGGGTNDSVNITGSTLTSFAGFQALAAGLGSVIGGNILQNTNAGCVLTLNLGTANQTDIWFLGTLAGGILAADLSFG
jgi:Ca2+-binding RTX toxin-like protein